MTMSHEKSAQAKDNPGVIMLPPLMFGLFFAAAIGLDWAIGWQFLAPSGPPSAWFYVGVALSTVAVALDLLGITIFLKARTNILPSQPSLALVTSSVYRLTRNPMYLGLLALLIGTSLIFSLEWGLVFWPAFALLLHFGVVLREERYLTAKFGKPYEDFLLRTRRWL